MRDAVDEERLAKANRRVGEWIMAVTQGAGARSIEGGEVTSWRVKMPTEVDPMVLLIVKASGVQGDYIGFIGAPNCSGALLAWKAREAADGMKWRVDRPWGEAKGR